jgi:hypothetical protein
LYPVLQQVKSKPSVQLRQPKKLQTKIKFLVLKGKQWHTTTVKTNTQFR